MADRRPAEEAAATDLSDDSRVLRERHKKRVVENHLLMTTNTTTTTTTNCCNNNSSGFGSGFGGSSDTMSVLFDLNDHPHYHHHHHHHHNNSKRFIVDATSFNNGSDKSSDCHCNNKHNNNNNNNNNNNLNIENNGNFDKIIISKFVNNKGGSNVWENSDVVDHNGAGEDDADDDDADEEDNDDDEDEDEDDDDEDEDEDEEEYHQGIRENKLKLNNGVKRGKSVNSKAHINKAGLLKKSTTMQEEDRIRGMVFEQSVINGNTIEDIVVLAEYGASGDCKADGNREPTSTSSIATTVVDAAAAAVAVSAIPETVKDLHQHKHSNNQKQLKKSLSSDVEVVARFGSPFKGQIRAAEDTLVGPCGKKRCADRYDSSESSDSGVAVSCGECSSSGTSDITEPGSPCSTSSDEGVAIHGKAPSPLPSVPKLAPQTSPLLNGTRPQWPWTPPLAATACSTYKRLNSEPEIGTLPKVTAADPTARSTKTSKLNHHHQHEFQGKITEYFKTQIKPQQSKTKKNSSEMSVMVAKNSPEFRRPLTVQRNKGGLAKYLGVVTPNSRSVANDWDVKSMGISSSQSPGNKKLSSVTPRVSVMKLDKLFVNKTLPGLPISSDVLSSIPGRKISSLRLTGEASPKPSGESPPSTPTPTLQASETLNVGFDNKIIKPIVSDNKNSTGTCTTVNNNNNNNCNHTVTRSLNNSNIIINSSGNTTNGINNTNIVSINNNNINNNLQEISILQSSEPSLLETLESKIEPTIVSSVKEDEEEEEEEEEDSSRSSESKPSSSPILCAPTTIRFPARAPTKNGARAVDSGFCRWDKCEVNFECSGALLEHLQTAHINTQTGGDNFVCNWQGCKVQGRTSCSRRWLERHVLSHGGNKPFRCIVDGCGSRFSSQIALERHVNNHFNQPETSSSSSRRSCENGGKLVRRNGKKLRYRRQPWSARLFDYFDNGVMEGLQHRLLELAKSRTQGQLASTPGNSMALTSQVLAKRVETDGKTRVLLRWYPQDITPDEWVLESEVINTKHIDIRKAATTSIDEVSLVLYPAVRGGTPPVTRVKQRRKPVKNS